MDLSPVWLDTSLRKIAPMVSFSQWPKWLTWKNFVRQVMKIPTKDSRISAGQPQTMLFSALFTAPTSSSA